MRRAALLTLVDLDPARFNLLRQRDQLPFATRSGNPSGWQDFTLDHAFRLRLMLDLMGDHGLGPEQARFTAFPEVSIDEAATAHPDIWVGVMAYAADDHTVCGHGHVTGTLANVTVETERMWREHVTGVRPEEASRLFLANASRVARLLRHRASELGITEGTD